jgi:hypothetical protein
VFIRASTIYLFSYAAKETGCGEGVRFVTRSNPENRSYSDFHPILYSSSVKKEKKKNKKGLHLCNKFDKVRDTRERTNYLWP